MMKLGLGMGLAASGAAASGWRDPLAGMDVAVRFQTHRGDGVPLGMYVDEGLSVAASSAGDPISVWADVLTESGLTASQTEVMKRGVLAFVSGVPVLRMDFADDGYGVGDGAEIIPLPYAISLLCASPAERPIGRVVNCSTGSPRYDNMLMHPRRADTTVQVGAGYPSTVKATDGEMHLLTVVAPVGGSFSVFLDGVDVTTQTVAAVPWRALNLGAVGFYAEPAGADLIALLVYPPEHRAAVEAYLNTLKAAPL